MARDLRCEKELQVYSVASGVRSSCRCGTWPVVWHVATDTACPKSVMAAAGKGTLTFSFLILLPQLCLVTPGPTQAMALSH